VAAARPEAVLASDVVSGVWREGACLLWVAREHTSSDV
jgi:hypothetical protein